MNQPAQEFLEEEGADLAPNRAETAVRVGSVGGKQWRQNAHQGGPVSLSRAQRASKSAK
jgi:hypothetical protein